MDFRILGPVEVVDEGRRVVLGPSKQRALLALLLLHVNEVVSRDRLVEDLWGERPPETATTALHGYVSHLRKILEEGNGRRLVTRSPGYVLEIDPEQVDLNRFELLAHRGKQELADGNPEAAATLADALSLWRGPPFAEFDSAPFAVAESLRLQELHIATLEDRIDADLALGRHAELVPELERLAAEHPFRERLHAQLMLALYRSGRQAEALEIYRTTRRRLVDELGIEPGPGLQELHQAILRQDRAIAPASAAPSDGRRSLSHRRALVAGLAVAAALVVGLALALGGSDDPPPAQLSANSVGFIEAKSGGVAKAFPVGREPSAVKVAEDSLWVANYKGQTITKMDRDSGASVPIPVDGHPIGIASYRDGIWAWTFEGLLVPIDPRSDRAGEPIRLEVGGRPRFERTPAGGRIVAGGSYLWLTAPRTTVIRIDPGNPDSALPTVPDTGAEGPIAYGNGAAWVAGSNNVSRVTADGSVFSGASVGAVRDLAFAYGSLWVVNGGDGTKVVPRLRRVDPYTGVPEATIPVGQRPLAVVAAAGSVWVAGEEGNTGMVYRVDPATNQVVDTITVGAIPTAIADDDDGVWVAVG